MEKLKRYVMKFIEPDGKSHLELNINFETKEKAKLYIDYYNSQIMSDMRFDILYMELDNEYIEKSIFFNKCVEDFSVLVPELNITKFISLEKYTQLEICL